MLAVKKLGRDDFGSSGSINNATGITETGMASEGNGFVSAAMRAAIHGETIRGIATGKDLFGFRCKEKVRIGAKSLDLHQSGVADFVLFACSSYSM